MTFSNEYVTGNLPIEFPDIHLSLANIGKAMDAAKSSGIPIIVVQQFAPAGSPIFAQGSAGWELHDVVRSRTWDHYIEKKLPSAFAGTNLAEWLSEHQIDNLSVVGYMTHNCVDSTIKHVFHNGLAVEFYPMQPVPCPISTRRDRPARKRCTARFRS